MTFVIFLGRGLEYLRQACGFHVLTWKGPALCKPTSTCLALPGTNRPISKWSKTRPTVRSESTGSISQRVPIHSRWVLAIPIDQIIVSSGLQSDNGQSVVNNVGATEVDFA